MKYIFVLVCFIPVVALASAPVPPPNVIADNASLFQWFLGICIVMIGFFLNRTLNTIEDNNKRQWEAIDLLGRDISALKGRCESNHQGGRRHYDPEERV